MSKAYADTLINLWSDYEVLGQRSPAQVSDDIHLSTELKFVAVKQFQRVQSNTNVG